MVLFQANMNEENQLKMPVSNRHDRINDAFERAVTKLQKNLQYLADNDKVSNKFLSTHNLILKSLIDYQQKTEMYIATLEFEIISLSKGKINEIEKLKIVQESFEIICIMHGIIDFPVLMSKGRNYLLNEVVYQHKENMITLPFKLQEMIDKLPEPERKALFNILYKNF